MSRVEDNIARIRHIASTLYAPHLFYYAAVSVDIKGDEHLGRHTGFFVAPNWNGTGPSSDVVDDDVLLICTRHSAEPPCVASAQQALRLRVSDESIPRGIAWVEVPLRNDRWYHAQRADVSIYRFKMGDFPDNCLVAAISRGYFFDPARKLFPFGILSCDVRLFGAWSERTDVPITLSRSGFVASPDSVQWPLDVSGADVKNEIYLVDACVTRAMSGGPVLVTTGIGSSENSLLGLIHGHWEKGYDEVKPPWVTVDPAVERLFDELAGINAHLVYVVSAAEIAAAIDEMLSSG